MPLVGMLDLHKVNRKMKPELSVIVPVYNSEKWLSETLESLFIQTYKNFEVILVNDASTDNIYSALNKISDSRLRCYHLSNNVGVSNARNYGVNVASGQYVAFCDADDICLPDRFERQVDFLKRNPHIGFCGSYYTRFDIDDCDTIKYPSKSSEIFKTLMTGNSFGMSTIMGKLDVFRKYPFNEEMSPCEDYDLWVRLAAANILMANLPMSLIRYRMHPQQSSSISSSRMDILSRNIRSQFCAEMLGDIDLLNSVRSKNISLNEMRSAKYAIVNYCNINNNFHPNDFRFFLAWLYQQLPDHGLRSYNMWYKIQRDLDIKLDFNYRVNIFILAIIPDNLKKKYLDILSKLKY